MSGSKEDTRAGSPPARQADPDRVSDPTQDEAARKRALDLLLDAKEPLAALEDKFGEFVEFVCVEIDDLCRRLREDLAPPEKSRAVTDFDRLTRAAERLRNILVKKHAADAPKEPDAAETLLDLMTEGDETGCKDEGAGPPEEVDAPDEG